MQNVRDQVVEAIEDGILNDYEVVIMLLKYMSEDDIKDCLKVNEIHLDPPW